MTWNMAVARKHKTEESLRDLTLALAGPTRSQDAYDLLFALLTPREREEIALRWQLVQLLAEGLSQRAISGQLGISLCKITRGARELKSGSLGFRKAVFAALRRHHPPKTGNSHA
jgi:TrpR family trp operon transcriptional repressor